jgi:hypothetical protein
LLLTTLLLAAAALLGALLLTLQAHEHQRYARAALRGMTQPWHSPPAVLVCVPCKGIDLELADNLRSVLSQDYTNYRVRFVVESASDPACQVIQQAISTSCVPSELLVAGPCNDSGQKVHNLRCATADLPRETEVLAFFDSDARPAPDALARLVDCICRSEMQVATGYRWLVPRRPSFANLTLASINAAALCLFKRRGWNLIWGGGWAVTRELFERTALAAAWQGTLSDDLVASRVLRQAGATVVFEPGCVALSPIDVTWREAATFLRRQFVIGRCYAPWWWWATMPLMVIQPVVLIGGLSLAPISVWTGKQLWLWPLLVSLTLYALSALRSRWRQAVWCTHFTGAAKTLRSAARFDLWASPWSCLFAAGMMLASVAGRSITWRGLRYHIGPAGRITLLGRIPDKVERAAIRAAHFRRRHRNEAARNCAPMLVTSSAPPENSHTTQRDPTSSPSQVLPERL